MAEPMLRFNRNAAQRYRFNDSERDDTWFSRTMNSFGTNSDMEPLKENGQLSGGSFEETARR